MGHEIPNHQHNGVSYEETLALLRYMADHNVHHAKELEETIDILPEEAAKRVSEAAALLRRSAGLILLAIDKARA